MRFAYGKGGKRIEPSPGIYGICGLCYGEMIPKCGKYVRWHWAHKSTISCDPWHQSETDWHRIWKDCFPTGNQEVVHVDPLTGETHIADVKTDCGRIVEIQHSPISDQELLSREDFYGDMFWIVDARHLYGNFCNGTSYDLAYVDPMCYHFEWYSRSTLLKRWSVARKPVYFDTRIWSKFAPDVKIPSSSHVLWRLLEFDFNDNRGFIAPVASDMVVNSALEGDPAPLMQCEEHDAWRFRRELVEVSASS